VATTDKGAPLSGEPREDLLWRSSYDQKRVHDRWRGVLTVWLLAIFTLLVLFLLYVVLFRVAVLTTDAKTFLTLITSGLIGLIGTILGYFFASQRGT
jgi:fructose-specific phosphotransferase system IIC component